MNIGGKCVREIGNKYFIKLSDAKEQLLLRLGEKYKEDLFTEIIDRLLIIVFFENEEKYLYIEDLEICSRIIELNYNVDLYNIHDIGYNGTFLVKKMKISEETYLLYEFKDSQKIAPAFVRNILYHTKEVCDEKCEMQIYELLGTTVVTTNKKICEYIENAIYREYKLSNIKNSNFANSSSYMGTKKKIIGFIIEAMFPHCKENAVFLDIMCGSGVVSGALAQMGKTCASDAQDFCKLLAKIQGGGLKKERAQNLINEIYRHYRYNLKELESLFGEELETEEKIFYMALDEKEIAFGKYVSFVESFKLYSDTEETTKEIYNFVKERKEDIKKVPYCLFSYYFANVYFGLAQSIQLDSIRYAIDQIANEEEKEWALGVLVVVTSVIATSHGGHFAQPKKLDINSFEKILDKRKKSAWLEFSKRLLTIAEESEKTPYEVKLIKGPWENALSYFEVDAAEQLVVYLDAPYKREEYSRYYHVLETIVKYDYPSSEYKGRLRSKKNGERFSTEFFTRISEKIENVFEKIILEILAKNAICVWSYSDNAAISLMNVVTRVKEKCNCDVYFYSTPHKYLLQGKTAGGKKKEREYCIVYVRR